MLDMSQLQTMNEVETKKTAFDIAEVIRLSLVSLEGKILDKNLDVDASLPEEPIMTLGDMDSITQVVYNLIDNARKFAEPGTSIGIELWKEGGKAHVSVSNRGETIPREELPLIFDRFHKSDRSRSASTRSASAPVHAAPFMRMYRSMSARVTFIARVCRAGSP